jgi:hypothetical protein
MAETMSVLAVLGRETRLLINYVLTLFFKAIYG